MLFRSILVGSIVGLISAGVNAQPGGKTYTNIRQVDLRNFQYESAVTVKDGMWKGEFPGEYFAIGKIVYGDLTGDGKEEAGIITSRSGGGSGHDSSALVYTLKNGKPIALQSRDREGYGPYDGIVGGDRGRGGIHSIRIKNGLLYVEQYAPSDKAGAAPYAAAFIETVTYKWNGTLFTPIGRVTKVPYHK